MAVSLCLFLFLLETAAVSSGPRLYPHKVDPRENPDYNRYAVTHPTEEDLGHTPQFATLRTLRVKDRKVDYVESIEQYLLNPNTTLGQIVWPRGPEFMFADNYKDFVDYVKAKGLSITSVHGFSPVSAGYRPPKEVLNYLEEALGRKWFGVANGEQDGHYFGGFLEDYIPQNMSPTDQYLNFREYFRAMEDILGPKMTTLLSSTFPHHQLKTGLYTIAGAETSQSGPNAQLRYSFIRGAGKQYGTLWFGNVSVYNRFGHKVYLANETSTSKSSKKSSGASKNSRKPQTKNTTGRSTWTAYKCEVNITQLEDPFGPSCGTSLNLMKRLMYAQMMYNSAYVSFEGGWFYKTSSIDQLNTTLTPIGLLQHNAYLWSQKIQDFGTHVATVALYLEFFGGWTPPRLKRGVMYRMWSRLPYLDADHFTDEVLRMLYPNYQDASYFHDETGASSPTPYGDILDVVLSDASPWVLQQYDTIIVGGSLSSNLMEVAHNLEHYVTNGGTLILTAGNLGRFPNGILNVMTDLTTCKLVPAGSHYTIVGEQEDRVESYTMNICNITTSGESLVIAQMKSGIPLVLGYSFEKGGSLIIFASTSGVSHDQQNHPINDVDKTLTSPYPMLDHVQTVLHSLLTQATLLGSGFETNLSTITNYLGDGNYLTLVSNPQLKEQPLKLWTPLADVTQMTEIPLDKSEKDKIGYLPDGFQNVDIGKSTEETIAGGDTRLFALTLQGEIDLIPKVEPKPRPKGMGLHLRQVYHSIRYSILQRPTFFQHFDSVVVDYKHLISKDTSILNTERKWLEEQKVVIYVDASPSINLFPGLRLTNDAPDFYNRSVSSLENLIHKMSLLGSHDLIISLHLFPSSQTKEESETDFNYTLHRLIQTAASYNITVHMLDTPKNPFELMPMSRWLDENGLSSVKFILSLAALVNYGAEVKYDNIIDTRSSMLYVSAPGRDEFGMNYTLNAPIAQVSDSIQQEVAAMLDHVCQLRTCPYKTGTEQDKKQNTKRNLSPSSHDNAVGSVYPIVMDAEYLSVDDEYADISFMESLLLPKSKQESKLVRSKD